MTNDELEKEVLTLKSDLARAVETLRIQDSSLTTLAALIGNIRDKFEDRIGWIEHKQDFDIRGFYNYAITLEDELGIEVLNRVNGILKEAVQKQVKPKSFAGFGFDETA